jgi:hypothetical protein
MALTFVLVGCGDDSAVDATCGPWCAVVDECTNTSADECTDACVEELSQAQDVSSECADAVRDQNQCLGALDCAEFDAWLDEVPAVGYPCNDEDDGVDAACF